MYLHVPCIAGKHRLSFAGPDGFPFFIRSCGTRRCGRVRHDQLRPHVIPLHDRENFPIQSVWKIVSGLTLSRSRPLARLTHAPGAMPCVNSSPVSARRPAACARTFCLTSLNRPVEYACRSAIGRVTAVTFCHFLLGRPDTIVSLDRNTARQTMLIN